MLTQTQQPYQFESRSISDSGAKCLTSVEVDSPDVQLIQRFQEGDSEVFNLLYRRYRDRIYGVICSIVSNHEDALDITQDVFLKAYQGLGNFRRVSQFYSWLYRIAINCCIDHMRRRSKHRVLSNDLVSDDVFYRHEVTRHLSPPSKPVELEEFGMFLHQAVLQLTPKQREVFTLRYKEDLSLKEIAIKMERSIGTVKAHLFQIHRKLRKMVLPYLRYDRIETWGSNKHL